MSTLVSGSLQTETAFARDVRDGLLQPGQKSLPSQYFYDDLGSALFEAITLLPEYGLTRADARILRDHAGEIVDSLPRPVRVVELGSGTGQKTRYLLEALSKRQRNIAYLPIDVSEAALEHCRVELSELAKVTPIPSLYLPGLRQAAESRARNERLLVLFLGSTIGNFSREAAQTFLGQLRGILRGGDGLLLGVDLVKPREQLLVAYDDPTGVTAAFNLNLLSRINRELGANFNLRQFQHQSRYDERRHRVEMHLRSCCAQIVEIPSAGCTAHFQRGETIWTESSHKYQTGELREVAGAAGFCPEAEWIDGEWPFAECLWIAI